MRTIYRTTFELRAGAQCDDFFGSFADAAWTWLYDRRELGVAIKPAGMSGAVAIPATDIGSGFRTEALHVETSSSRGWALLVSQKDARESDLLWVSDLALLREADGKHYFSFTQSLGRTDGGIMPIRRTPGRPRIIAKLVKQFIASSGGLRLHIRADIAWNLSTAAYYKSGARPWKLHGVRPGVCYLGLVFKQDNTANDPRNACCAAQMFLDSGDGVVFKGSVGKWYTPETRQFHLSRAAAKEIVALTIAAYAAKNYGEKPKELFIHGRTRFDDVEWAGFNDAAGQATKVVGIRIIEANDIRLYRQGSRMPILRGLAHISDRYTALLWTKGFVPRLQTFPGGKEVPKPIIVNVCRGEHDIEVVLNDVLRLTKLNYNCCRFSDGMPVTLKFADAVGEILTSGPVGGEVPLPFKHYI